jgi:hypothetical protein
MVLVVEFNEIGMCSISRAGKLWVGVRKLLARNIKVGMFANEFHYHTSPRRLHTGQKEQKILTS